MTEGGPSLIRRFIGFALAAVGALIAVTAGLCTGLGLLSMVSNAIEDRNVSVSQVLVALGLPAVVGGIPTAIGVAVAIAGWRMATRR